MFLVSALELLPTVNTLFSTPKGCDAILRSVLLAKRLAVGAQFDAGYVGSFACSLTQGCDSCRELINCLTEIL